MNKRYCFVKFFVGHNRTGKTTTAVKFAEKYARENPNNKIFAFDPQNKFTHLMKSKSHILRDKDNDWGKLLKAKIKRSLIVCDDYHIFVDERINKDLQDLMTYRNEWGLDFIFITHSPKFIRQKLSYYATHLFLFFTVGSVKNFKDKLPDEDRAIRARNYINKFWMKFTDEEKQSFYPNFPYIVVDFLSNNDYLVNIKK